jgi:hypothetical protein
MAELPQGMADADAPLDPMFTGQPNTAHSVGEKTSQQVRWVGGGREGGRDERMNE